MAKKQPAKPEEFRAGNPEHVNYPDDPKGEVHLSHEQIRRHKYLAEEAREAKRDGDRNGYDAVMGVWREEPGFGTNTNVRTMIVRNDAVPFGTTTVGVQGDVIGGGAAEAKRKPGKEVLRVIKLIQAGQSNDDICRAIPDKSVDAIKRIRCDLGKGQFDLS